MLAVLKRLYARKGTFHHLHPGAIPISRPNDGVGVRSQSNCYKDVQLHKMVVVMIP